LLSDSKPSALNIVRRSPTNHVDARPDLATALGTGEQGVHALVSGLPEFDAGIV
jgi:hypothetical protein